MVATWAQSWPKCSVITISPPVEPGDPQKRPASGPPPPRGWFLIQPGGSSRESNSSRVIDSDSHARRVPSLRVSMISNPASGAWPGASISAGDQQSSESSGDAAVDASPAAAFIESSHSTMRSAISVPWSSWRKWLASGRRSWGCPSAPGIESMRNLLAAALAEVAGVIGRPQGEERPLELAQPAPCRIGRARYVVDQRRERAGAGHVDATRERRVVGGLDVVGLVEPGQRLDDLGRAEALGRHGVDHPLPEVVLLGEQRLTPVVERRLLVGDGGERQLEVGDLVGVLHWWLDLDAGRKFRESTVSDGDGRVSVRVETGGAQPDEAAPVLTEQVDVGQAQLLDEGLEPLVVTQIAVGLDLGGLVGPAHPEVVHGDHPVAGIGEHRDHVPVQVGPRRLAVEEQHDLAVGGTLVHVGLSQAVDLHVLGLIRPVRQALEARIRRPHEVHIVVGGEHLRFGITRYGLGFRRLSRRRAVPLAAVAGVVAARAEDEHGGSQRNQPMQPAPCVDVHVLPPSWVAWA